MKNVLAKGAIVISQDILGVMKRQVNFCTKKPVVSMLILTYRCNSRCRTCNNWKRPQEEIDILMSLLCEYLQKELHELDQQNVCIRAIGHVQELPERARQELARSQERTADNDGLILNIALNYGGRLEILDAARRLASEVRDGELEPQAIDESRFSDHLYTAGLPDPDLLIRPAGEMRVSNFLLWQIAYTEFWSTPVYWPDFKDRSHFLSALLAYQDRERRFGGL